MKSENNVPLASAGPPALDVEVVMRREPVVGAMRRWQTWQWAPADVRAVRAPFVVTGPAAKPTGPEPVEPEDTSRHPAGTTWWRWSGLRVELHRDDAEGHFLNLESPSPCFWVFWRPDDDRLLDGEPMAVPQIVTLSYHEAGRWLDAQERVDTVPACEAVVDWLGAFVAQHHRVEPKRRKRPESFRPLTDRFGQPVRISTQKGPPRSGEGGA